MLPVRLSWWWVTGASSSFESAWVFFLLIHLMPRIDLVPACRVFFSELVKSDLLLPEEGKTVLVTPTGARCRKLYAVAELEGIEQRGTISRVTVNDSTASLHIYTETATAHRAGLEQAPRGAVIAFTGTVHRREGSKRPIILAEEVGIVGEDVRKSWILTTARRTLERIERLRVNLAIQKDEGGSKQVLEHYALDTERLDALASMAINAVERLWQQYCVTIREHILELVKRAGKRGVDREKILGTLKARELPEEWINDLIDDLIREGRCSESGSSIYLLKET